MKPDVSVAQIEARRERTVRAVDCPICGAEPGNVCDETPDHSHTGRYLAAVERGLVPAMPGEATQ